MNELIRKAREIEGIRARLVEAEQSGFTALSREQIRAEIRQGTAGFAPISGHDISAGVQSDTQPLR